MAKAPPIPKEQRNIKGDRSHVENDVNDRRDETTGLQSAQPGDDDVNLAQQGRHGNIRQNTTQQGTQQDR